jgi:ABC-type multidrug transport system fused ATPase/permease subunit
VKKSGKRNPVLYLFAKMWRYSEGNRKNILLFLSLFVVAESLTLFGQPLIWARMLDVIQKQGIVKENIQMLLGLLGLTLCIDLAFWLLHGPARLMERTNAFGARQNYRKFLLKGVMMLPMEWHADHHSGDTIDRVEKGTNALYQSSESSSEIVYAIVQLIGSYAMLCYFSPSSSYIVLAMILITAWITIRFDRVLVKQYQELNRKENNISESTFDAISNITTVIILRVERLIFNAIASKIEKPLKLYEHNSRLSEIKWFLTSMCCTAMTILVLSAYFLGHIGAAKGILIGSVYLLIQYLHKISELFFQFTRMYGEVLQRKAKVMNSEELSQDFRTENFTNHVLPPEWKHLEIKNLDFSYEGNGDGKSDEDHLKNISLSINRGERIAFVGKSGSGKTTLLEVMRDLYHPRNITLRVDGKIIAGGLGGIARAIALVPQNPEIFATTVLENITLGAEHNMEFVRHFTDMACFTDVAENLPRKFDSSIKEKGVNLSGGEQQRLALSRGLLACHDKDIVLLDEPTSSLDTTNEMVIYENVFREFEGKTIISSIHRLHLLPLFDRIYIFNSGEIIASGNLKELLSQCPEFQALWQEYNKHNQEKLPIN